MIKIVGEIRMRVVYLLVIRLQCQPLRQDQWSPASYNETELGRFLHFYKFVNFIKLNFCYLNKILIVIISMTLRVEGNFFSDFFSEETKEIFLMKT